jgi:hypothetical protein
VFHLDGGRGHRGDDVADAGLEIVGNTVVTTSRMLASKLSASAAKARRFSASDCALASS